LWIAISQHGLSPFGETPEELGEDLALVHRASHLD